MKPTEVDRLELHFDFSIKGKARPKFDGRSGRAYMPDSYTANKEMIIWVLRQALFSRPDWFSADHLFIQQSVLYRRRRKQRSKSDGLRMEEEMPYGWYAPGASNSPDIDNFIGTIMDSGNGILYRDDSQVVSSLEERRWADSFGAFYRLIKIERTP